MSSARVGTRKDGGACTQILFREFDPGRRVRRRQHQQAPSRMDAHSLGRGRRADLLLQSLLDGEETPYRSVAHAAADPTAPHTLRGAVAVSSAASSGPAVPMPAAMPPTTTVDGVALVDRGLISGRGGLFGGLEYQRGGERGSCQDRGRCKYERGRNCDAYQCAAKALIRNHRYFLTRLHRAGRRPPLSRFGIRARVYELGIPFGGFHRSVASAHFPGLGFAAYAPHAPFVRGRSRVRAMAHVTSGPADGGCGGPFRPAVSGARSVVMPRTESEWHRPRRRLSVHNGHDVKHTSSASVGFSGLPGRRWRVGTTRSSTST